MGICCPLMNASGIQLCPWQLHVSVPRLGHLMRRCWICCSLKPTSGRMRKSYSVLKLTMIDKQNTKQHPSASSSTRWRILVVVGSSFLVAPLPSSLRAGCSTSTEWVSIAPVIHLSFVDSLLSPLAEHAHKRHARYEAGSSESDSQHVGVCQLSLVSVRAYHPVGGPTSRRVRPRRVCRRERASSVPMAMRVDLSLPLN